MKSQQKSWMLKFSTLIVVTACFSVLLASLLVSKNLNKLLVLWGEDIQMTVYLSDEIQTSEKQKIQDWLSQQSSVEKVDYINQKKAFENFQTQLSSYAPNLSEDEELLKMIPASLEIKLSYQIPEGQELKTMQSLKEGLSQLPGVDEISYGQDWVQKYSALVSGFRAGFNGLGLILSLAVLFIISNVVRTSVFSRHDEIVVLEMIGASFKRIRKPFLVEGAILGFVSPVVALGVCGGFYLLGTKFVSENLSFLKLSENLEFFSLPSIVLFLFVGTTIGTLASYFCVRSINDGFSGSQRGAIE